MKLAGKALKQNPEYPKKPGPRVSRLKRLNRKPL
jgi:hypothetical protein